MVLSRPSSSGYPPPSAIQADLIDTEMSNGEAMVAEVKTACREGRPPTDFILSQL
jgi:hypothetical protein